MYQVVELNLRDLGCSTIKIKNLQVATRNSFVQDQSIYRLKPESKPTQKLHIQRPQSAR